MHTVIAFTLLFLVLWHYIWRSTGVRVYRLISSACPVLVSPFPAPTPNTKIFSPISGPLPSVHHKSQPSPAFPQYFPNILSYARLWDCCSQSINFCLRPLNISSTPPLKGLKSPFKWLNNRYSNISSLNEVRRLLTIKPAMLKILSIAAVVSRAMFRHAWTCSSLSDTHS